MCSIGFSSLEHPKARKSRRCAACSVPIPAGAIYARHSGVWDGEFSSDSWHVECLEAFGQMLRENGDDCGDPWDTWEDDMPDDIKARYVLGPWPGSSAKEATT